MSPATFRAESWSQQCMWLRMCWGAFSVVTARTRPELYSLRGRCIAYQPGYALGSSCTAEHLPNWFLPNWWLWREEEEHSTSPTIEKTQYLDIISTKRVPAKTSSGQGTINWFRNTLLTWGFSISISLDQSRLDIFETSDNNGFLRREESYFIPLVVRAMTVTQSRWREGNRSTLEWPLWSKRNHQNPHWLESYDSIHWLNNSLHGEHKWCAYMPFLKSISAYNLKEKHQIMFCF